MHSDLATSERNKATKTTTSLQYNNNNDNNINDINAYQFVKRQNYGGYHLFSQMDRVFVLHLQIWIVLNQPLLLKCMNEICIFRHRRNESDLDLNDTNFFIPHTKIFKAHCFTHDKHMLNSLNQISS